MKGRKRHNRRDLNRRGQQEAADEPRFLVIGRVARPHGVRGEVRVEIYTELPERFTWLDVVYMSRRPDDPDPRPVPVKGVRFHQGYALLKLDRYETRSDVEALRGAWLMVPGEEALPLEEGEHYHYQLEGLEIYTDQDVYLGQLTEILETGANEVFVVQGPQGEVLLPNITEVVQEVDVAEGRMVVHLLEGLI
ncbi:MAG: ribosome maturation factor RimM [Candidatus Promineifilaceae bacterium]|nr:ribosome maturation factor RimM [Candidatus Promineifilaceae bacterium]